ncbi:MAG: SIR2 family NAD-dependent protein deacylase [Actinomycetota bacterium]
MTDSHVFVTMGSLTNVACDAWLLPSDREYSIRPSWCLDVPGLEDAVASSQNEAFSAGSIYTVPLAAWPLGRPLPVLTAVPLCGMESTQDLVPPLLEFIKVGADQARSRRGNAETARPVPLLAIPLFGTGAGGAGRVRGEVLGLLLEESLRAAAEAGVDVVLVLRNKNDFALAQELRKRTDKAWWQSLEPELHAHAEELSQDARAGRLVPFMGAGVSISAGAPGWKELIRRLALLIDLSDDELKALTNRDVLDQAGILRTLYEERSEANWPSFNEAIASEVRLEHYGLAPALLASLPSKQAITLNYDELFELASSDAGLERTVIPDDDAAVSDRWLLKLHGSAKRPESIVLTRDDYLGFSTSRDALSALVKATLITHHLLFVGFGLEDDHFHEIVHDVRRALPDESKAKPELATALTLFRDPLDDRAWKDKLTLIPMSRGTDVGVAARTLEIFLDLLLARATDSHAYLLADGYEEALSEEELSLRTKLLQLTHGLTAAEVSSSGGMRLLKMLRELGG